MKNFTLATTALLTAFALPAYSAVTIYDKDDTTVSVDGSFNAFVAFTDVSSDVADRSQAHVRSGVLPNFSGTTFSKKVGDLTFGGRASFWISINDSNDVLTDRTVDTRQFYGTVAGDWGTVLVGSDFTVFNATNIFSDLNLKGFGYTTDALGLVDGTGVSFGNIGTGFTYPLPTAQIKYTSPDLSGFKLTAALVDPTDTSLLVNDGNRGEESVPRIEAELSYAQGPFTGWVSVLNQKSKNIIDVSSSGVSAGFKYSGGGFNVHVSGYDGEGLGLLLGPADGEGLGLNGFIYADGDEVDSSGLIAQASYTAGKNTFLVSAGKSELESANRSLVVENESRTLAWHRRINDTFLVVSEFTQSEINLTNEETDTVTVGLVMDF